MKGGGSLLPQATRSFFESRFGVDFSSVRIHTGVREANTARSINARAFTVGQNIAFGAGQYAPESTAGKNLIAHELTHTIQQGALSSVRGSLKKISLLQRKPIDPRHARGHAGEQSIAFILYRFEDGWAVIRGPGGAGGHGVTTRGEDGLFYNVRTRELHIVDNKSLARRGNVSGATAIDPTRNLMRNLNDMIRHVESQSPQQLPMRQRALRLLRQARAALRNGQSLPGRVRLIVGNAGGSSTGVTARLRRLGVRFVNVNQPVVPHQGTRRALIGTTVRGGTSGPSGGTSGRRASPGMRGAAGLVLVIQGANFVLQWVNDKNQEKRVRKAINALEPRIKEIQRINPTSGVLLRIFYAGARFGHIEMGEGVTLNEARQNATQQPKIRPSASRSVQDIWIPPVRKASVSAMQPPFRRFALATFVSGRNKLQDVMWGGITGFDDEGETTLSVSSGSRPRFFILEAPRQISFFNGPYRSTVDIPIVSRAAARGGNVSVVDLDPVMFGNVSATMVFPATDSTKRLFAASPRTRDNLNQLRAYSNFRLVRWIRPENLRVIRIL